MKLLLVAVNAKYIHSNLAVHSLRASAGAWKSEVEIAEYTINHLRGEVLADLYRRKPDVAAFSCYIWNMEFITSILDDLKKVLPDTDIWLGGPEVSFDGEDVLRRNRSVCGVMVGEGESTFRELAAWYHGEGELHGIRGLVYRRELQAFTPDGILSEFITTPPRPYEDMDALPFVYEDLDAFQNRIIYYESSRGCPFSCSYCLSSIDRRVRFRSLALVKRELLFFLERRVPQVKFVDRTFNANPGRTCEILRFLRENDNGVTNFHFEISADILGDEEIELLGSLRPGLVQLEVGVQSTDGTVLDAINRGAEFDEIAGRVRRIRAGKNVHQHLDLIAGLPYGTLVEFQSSFDDVYSLRPQQFQLGFLKLLKGSEMARRAGEFGIVCTERPPYEVLRTRWLSYGEILKLKGVEEMVEVYYNSWQFERSMELLLTCFSDAFSLYAALADFYERRGHNGRSHSRMERFLILRDFASTLETADIKALDAALILDLYAREKSKSRPAFAPDLSSRKDEIYEFYKREAREHRYLSEEPYAGMTARQLLNQTHLEILSEQEGEGWYLFDYSRRDPLTYSAIVTRLSEESIPSGERQNTEENVL